MIGTAFRRGATALRQASLLVARVEMFLAQVLIAGFTGLILFNVIRRYTINRPLYFAEELAVYILIWTAFLAIAVTIARLETIRLTFLVDVMGPRGRLILAVISETLVALMLAAMTYAAWKWFNHPAIAFERALTLGLPKWPFLLIIPLFCTLSLFHAVANVLHLIANGDERTAA